MTIFQKVPTDLYDRNELISKSIDSILNGEIDPLKALATLKHMENIVSAIKQDPSVTSLIEDEIAKYGKGEKPTAYGFEISSSSRKTYDYSVCGDYQLETLESEAKAKTELVKDRQKFLQSLNQTIVDAENGGFEIKPPMVKTSSFFVLKEVKESVDISKDKIDL